MSVDASSPSLAVQPRREAHVSEEPLQQGRFNYAGAGGEEEKLQCFLHSLSLDHHQAVLQEEEMFLDVLQMLSPDELDSSLKELKIPMGARRKITKALSETSAPPAVPSDESGSLTRQDAVPHEFKCPITLEIMTDPVQASDGHTYEKSAIVAWLETRRSSPVTNNPLAAGKLVPNFALRSQIASFHECCGGQHAHRHT